ncbi:MAG: RDD family protein [Deltaproteobacteria bacterium]|nr:RDD family protein [Deltaproteobacteria bacterium]
MAATAGIGKRFVAFMIDGFILSLVRVLVLVPIFGKRPTLPMFAAVLLYFALMEGSKYRATLGKMVMGLYVGDMDGKPLAVGTSFVRAGAKIFSSVILFVGFVVAFFTQNKQALHDLIAKTMVYDKKEEAAPAPAATPGE